MKAFVAGLILIVLSGAALLWQRWHDATPAAQGPERTTRCMVWKAQRGHATVWLCGSSHLLRKEDYPLPQPYLTAFEEATVVVMELLHGEKDWSRAAKVLHDGGRLPAGVSLKDSISSRAWSEVEKWALGPGNSSSYIGNRKPWAAALAIASATSLRLGFGRAYGMEAWFAARLGNRFHFSLETPEQQLAMFDGLPAPVQEQMIFQAVEEYHDSSSADNARRMIAAWRNGEPQPLFALMERTVGKFPALQKTVLTDRNAAWVPRIETYLDGTETVMVLVGSGHLAGPGSIIDLLERKGVTLTQMEYRTTRAEE